MLDSPILWILIVIAITCLLIALFMFRRASLAEDDLLDDVSFVSDTVAIVTAFRDIVRGWEYSIYGRIALAISAVSGIAAAILYVATQK